MPCLPRECFFPYTLSICSAEWLIPSAWKVFKFTHGNPKSFIQALISSKQKSSSRKRQLPPFCSSERLLFPITYFLSQLAVPITIYILKHISKADCSYWNCSDFTWSDIFDSCCIQLAVWHSWELTRVFIHPSDKCPWERDYVPIPETLSIPPKTSL